MHATRQSIPTFLIVTDGPRNAQLSNNVHLGLFDQRVRFLTLAAVWRTIQILESHKQGSTAPRLRLAANQKNLDLEKSQPGRKHHEKDLYDLITRARNNVYKTRDVVLQLVIKQLTSSCN